MARTKIVHIAARQRSSDDSILVFERAAWLWAALERSFPKALFSKLMRDHIHLVTPVVDLGAARQSLGRILGNYARRFDLGDRHWRRTGAPVPVRHRTMLRMTVRYVALNACRDRRARDPLESLWSTHRDVMGAVARPWVDADRLAAALGYRATGFRERFHALVTRDPSVSVEGTPPPEPAPSTTERSFSLGEIAAAAAIAHRQPTDAVRRSGRVRALFIALAADQGWCDPASLMDASASSRTTVNRLLRTPIDPHALYAARLCLADSRLRGR